MSSNESVVYTVSDIQEILGLKRSTAYNFVTKMYETQTFKVLRIGNSYRIPKKSFNNWLENEQ